MTNLAVFVGITGSAIGLLLAAFSLGLARSPFWAERRQFAVVAATAAGYCAFDVALVLDLPAETIAFATQVALAFAVAHCIAWIKYLAIADQRPLRRAERRMVFIGWIIALAGFVPGLLMTRELFTNDVAWLGITYRTPQPTLLGGISYFYLCAVMFLVGSTARHRWRDGWHARLPLIGAATLAVLAINDTLVSAAVISMPLLLDAGSISVALVVAIVHERRFAANMHQLERASSELRRQVEMRTGALLQTQAALAATERLAGLGRLTAGVAHEINNPIAVVQHSLERIRESSGGSPATQRHIENGLAATERVVRIVRRLLDAGRVSGTEAARAEPLFVAIVARKATEMVSRHLADVRVSVEIPEGLTALGDPGLISQVLENLLVNAAQALEGAPDGCIDIRAQHVGERLLVRVSDNGPGMSDEVRARLFEPFVTTKPIGKGSGLGLAVSKGLMRSQNGDLELVRTSSAGTEMLLWLPWTSRMPAPFEPDVPAAAPVAAAPKAGLTMLIIDDEPDVREMLVDICSIHFDVLAVDSVVEGLASMQDGRVPDVVLCDLMMPDGGADEWLTQCDGAYPDVAERTVIITGGPATPRDEALVAANARRVLFKPFSVAQLNAVIARVAPESVA